MLTRNLWSEVGLVNGIRGDVVDIVWAHGEKAPAFPDFVVLRLEGYTGPVLSNDPRYQGCVPRTEATRHVTKYPWSFAGQ